MIVNEDLSKNSSLYKKYSLVETWLFRKRRRRLCKELGRASSCCLRRKDVHRTVFFRIQMNTQFFFHIY